MRISELSRESGVPVATIKYYLREGLLPPGASTAVNQASYGDEHLRRLRLIGVLTDVGGLRLRTVARVLEAVDDEGLSTHHMLGVAHHALGPEPTDDADLEPALTDVARLLAARGWQVSDQAPSRRALAHALCTLRRLGRNPDHAVLDRYADAVDQLASKEVPHATATVPRTEAIENLVIGTIVYEAVLIALRRLAQEHHSAQRLAVTTPSSRTGHA